MGHLLEVCEGSNVSAIVNYSKVPVFKEIHDYIDKKCVPGGTLRNWDSYGNIENEKQRHILCDPQKWRTIDCCQKEAAQKVESILKK
jgi:selenide,water dikinase